MSYSLEDFLAGKPRPARKPEPLYEVEGIIETPTGPLFELCRDRQCTKHKKHRKIPKDAPWGL